MARFHEFSHGQRRVFIDLDSIVAVEDRMVLDTRSAKQVLDRTAGAEVYVTGGENAFTVDLTVDEVMALLNPPAPQAQVL